MVEFLIIVSLLVLIVLISKARNSIESKIDKLSRKIDDMEMGYERKEYEPFKPREEVKPVSPPKPIVAEDPAPVIKSVPEVEKPMAAFDREDEFNEDILEEMEVIEEPGYKKRIEKEPGFFERNPDWEKFIGENLINKIGIAILVLGIGFFVKYAIDKQWINEIGRVFIGIIAGGILVAVAHYLRNSFKAFSSVLIGGGLSVFYFTIAIAFHEYHIFSQTAAFIIMLVITGFSVLLSITYNRIELAVLAMIGGFASPFMVSTGEGNYIVLFTYVLILNLGMLVLAYFKSWHLVNIIAFVFTVILYGGWLGTRVVDNPEEPYPGGLIFATLFYIVFFVMNIINNIREQRKFLAAQITMLISNTFLYFSAGMILLQSISGGFYQGLFTASIAIFNFLFAFVLYKNKRVDLNLVYLLIGLVLTFLSLAAPIQLKGNYITLFWAAEAVLLLWLSQKSGIQLIKLAAVVVSGLMVISLVMDWVNIYSGSDPLIVVLNKGFITSAVSLISLVITILLLKKEENVFLYGIEKRYYANFLRVSLLVLLYFTILLELSYQLKNHDFFSAFRIMVLASYHYVYILGLMIWANRRENTAMRMITNLLSVAAAFSYIVYIHFQVVEIRDYYLEGTLSGSGYFMYHLFVISLVSVLLALGLRSFIKTWGIKDTGTTAYLWFLAFALMFISSAELDHLVVISNYVPGMYTEVITDQNHKIGFPILWGICSFLMMILGMRNKLKSLRIISLTLFFITLLKLFIFDIKDISEGGKIAAFICLGVILLVMSFMYQKLKKLVMEDENKQEVNQ